MQIADLASQCTGLLNWVADTNSETLAQNLWKNKMKVKSSQKFPDFDVE